MNLLLNILTIDNDVPHNLLTCEQYNYLHEYVALATKRSQENGFERREVFILVSVDAEGMKIKEKVETKFVHTIQTGYTWGAEAENGSFVYGLKTPRKAAISALTDSGALTERLI